MGVEKKRLMPGLLLSIVPGLPQLYLGMRRKAAGLLIIDVMIVLTFIFSDSYTLRLLTTGIYSITFIPAAIESYQLLKYGENQIDTGARWYVVLLLLTTGFSALPLLWQSEYFSFRAKVAWSVAVPVLAILFFTVLARYWNYLENFIETMLTSIT